MPGPATDPRSLQSGTLHENDYCVN